MIILQKVVYRSFSHSAEFTGRPDVRLKQTPRVVQETANHPALRESSRAYRQRSIVMASRVSRVGVVEVDPARQTDTIRFDRVS